MSRVCVVTPLFNASPYIVSTIASVRLQTFESWHHVIVDDASTDGSAELVARTVSGDRRFTLLRQPANSGPSAARRRGASQEHDSEFLLFLDADDVLEPEMLASSVAYLDEHPAVDAVFTDHSYIGPNDESLGPEPGRWPWQRLVATRWWLTQLGPADPTTPFESFFLVGVTLPSMLVMRRRSYEATPGWDVSFGQGCEDTDLFLELALRGPIHHLAEPLVRYRRHPEQAAKAKNFEVRYQKLTTKWLSMNGRDEAQAARILAAAWFRAHRFGPSHSLLAVRQHARRRELRATMRSMKAFLLSYSPRRPPAGLYTRREAPGRSDLSTGPRK